LGTSKRTKWKKEISLPCPQQQKNNNNPEGKQSAYRHISTKQIFAVYHSVAVRYLPAKLDIRRVFVV
jgi:hypothetical protein